LLPATSVSGDGKFSIIPVKISDNIQGAAVCTPTFLKVNDKGVVGVGWNERWQQFGRIF